MRRIRDIDFLPLLAEENHGPLAIVKSEWSLGNPTPTRSWARSLAQREVAVGAVASLPVSTTFASSTLPYLGSRLPFATTSHQGLRPLPKCSYWFWTTLLELSLRGEIALANTLFSAEVGDAVCDWLGGFFLGLMPLAVNIFLRPLNPDLHDWAPDLIVLSFVMSGSSLLAGLRLRRVPNVRISRGPQLIGLCGIGVLGASLVLYVVAMIGVEAATDVVHHYAPWVAGAAACVSLFVELTAARAVAEAHHQSVTP